MSFDDLDRLRSIPLDINKKECLFKHKNPLKIVYRNKEIQTTMGRKKKIMNRWSIIRNVCVSLYEFAGVSVALIPYMNGIVPV